MHKHIFVPTCLLKRIYHKHLHIQFSYIIKTHRFDDEAMSLSDPGAKAHTARIPVGKFIYPKRWIYSLLARALFFLNLYH